MAETLSFDQLCSILVATVTRLPDHRTGPHRPYEIADAALGAFAIFFTQAPSFLAYQRDLQRRKGRNNAQSLFGVDQGPSPPARAGQGCAMGSPEPPSERPPDVSPAPTRSRLITSPQASWEMRIGAFGIPACQGRT